MLLHLMRKIFNHHIDVIEILWATFDFLLVNFSIFSDCAV